MPDEMTVVAADGYRDAVKRVMVGPNRLGSEWKTEWTAGTAVPPPEFYETFPFLTWPERELAPCPICDERSARLSGADQPGTPAVRLTCLNRECIAEEIEVTINRLDPGEHRVPEGGIEAPAYHLDRAPFARRGDEGVLAGSRPRRQRPKQSMLRRLLEVLNRGDERAERAPG